MNPMAARYERRAAVYDRWWAPVLAPTALRLLDCLEPVLAPDGSGRRLLDLGTGTGTLAVAAARRWPALEVVAADIAEAMLAATAAKAGAELRAGAGRIELLRVEADAALRLPPESLDAAVSSFTLQLVPDRPATLAALHGALRPGGRIAVALWGARTRRFLPADALSAALRSCGIVQAPEPLGAAGPAQSAASAAAEARRAGFKGVRAGRWWLEHRFDPGAHLDYLEQYREADTFRTLDEPARAALRAAVAAELARLEPSAFAWRVPVIWITGRRGR